MSNSYVASAFTITVNPDEAHLVELCFTIAATLRDEGPMLRERIAETIDAAFAEAFPPSSTDPDDLLSGFTAIFEDEGYYDLGCAAEATTGSADHSDLSIAGHQIQVESVARILQRCCRSALPFAFEWACYSDRLRNDEFGGGHCLVTMDEIHLVTTSDIARRAVRRTVDEGADGYVLELTTLRRTSYLGRDGSYGRLFDARIFSDAEAAALSIDPSAGRDLAWLAMPRPLGL